MIIFICFIIYVKTKKRLLWKTGKNFPSWSYIASPFISGILEWIAKGNPLSALNSMIMRGLKAKSESKRIFFQILSYISNQTGNDVPAHLFSTMRKPQECLFTSLNFLFSYLGHLELWLPSVAKKESCTHTFDEFMYKLLRS